MTGFVHYVEKTVSENIISYCATSVCMYVSKCKRFFCCSELLVENESCMYMVACDLYYGHIGTCICMDAYIVAVLVRHRDSKHNYVTQYVHVYTYLNMCARTYIFMHVYTQNIR
jgi:hypothetical protein